MEQIQRVSLSLLVCLGLVYLADAQAGLLCSNLAVGDLGSTTDFSEQGLIPRALVISGDSQANVPVRINNYRVLCDVSGINRGTSSSVSVLVQFLCNGAPNFCDGTTMQTRQYQFSCGDQNVWIPEAGGSATFVQTVGPTANFSTMPDDQCRLCVDERQLPAPDPTHNPDTHCQPCGSSCNQGQMRCYVGPTDDVCCNFYENNVCVAECTSPLVPDSNFDCGCGELTVANGDVSYSDGFLIGSVATHSCNTNHRLSPVGGAVRTCTTNGWSGQDVTCEVIQCPGLGIDNGIVNIVPSDRSNNSRTMYSCDDGYSLKGDGNRICQEDSTWSGADPTCAACLLVLNDPDCEECAFDSNTNNPVCTKCKSGFKLQDGKCETEVSSGGASGSSCSPGCIAGIVLAILGAIIMAIVVAVVVYAIYKYLSNPATKLAKTGTEGLNGVARDNPLYLPPEDVIPETGDVETA